MARVFLSHSSKDKPFVRELYRRLTRDGVTCFFDEESIEWGANFVLTLEEAIDTCQHFIVILSPDFVKSEWVKLERTSSMANDPAGIERKIRPLRLHPCTLPRFLTPIQSIDVSTTALFDANYPKICKALGGTVRPDPKPPTDRATLPPVTPLPNLFRMPYRSLEDKFVGRVDQLWAIFDQLSRGRTSIVQGIGVVSGIGGLGKTQLAVEYGHRFNHHYPGGVFWIEADQGIPRLIDVLSHSGEVEVDGKRPQPDQLEEIWTALTRRAAILAILDNFPEDVPLAPWLPPSGSIHVLVTTRRRDLSHLPVALPPLTAGEGLALLNSGRLRWGPEAQPLVEDVGGLPLALELLRSYLELRADLSVADIRRVLAETGGMSLLQEFADEYRDELPTGHERSVAATLQVSWDRAGIDARDVLRAMSHLAPVAVPLRLLRASLSWEHSPGPADRLEKALSELVRLSLTDRSPSNEPLAHRLILAFVRHLPESASAQLPVVQAVEKEMRRAFDAQDTGSFQQLEGIMPHAEFVISRPDVLPETAIAIATALGWHHKDLGRYVLAKSFNEDALSRAERSFEAGDPSIATSQSNLATVLQDLGELAEARDLLRKALASDERSHPPDHPYIATCQSNLAVVLKDLGELAEARDLLRKALASDERSFPPGHPTIAIRQSNLALVLQSLGELAEARDLLRKALASDERSFPPGHPEIATDQSNLAQVLQDLGELAEARDLLRKALASDERSFPPGHPSIARRQSNLAMVLQDLGELAEARDLMRKTLASNERSFPPGHPYIAVAQSNLALVLKDLGELDEAPDLLRKALASSERSFPPGHPSIARSQSNLATVLNALGELAEARDLLRKALAAALDKFGPDHPTTKTIQRNLDGLPGSGD